MTVIAWDGKTLAADRQITSGYTKNKRITKIRKYGNVLCGVTGETKYPRDERTSWGSGKELALGAMAAGADAKKAAEIACEYDLYCGGGVDVVEA